MTFSKPARGNVHLTGEDMARRRLQQKGELTNSGSYWRLRWHEDHIDADGEVKRGWSKSVCIGPSDGPGGFTEKQARRFAWDNFLSRLDQNNRTPQSIMTVRQFVDRKFVPEHVVYLKRSGKAHYESQLPFVLDGVPDKKRGRGGKTRFKPGEEKPKVTRRFGIGDMRLRDVRREDAQRLVGTMLDRGYSTQAAKHVKTVISAIYTHAIEEDWFSGRNPAQGVRLPEMVRATGHALSFDQLSSLLPVLPPMVRIMVFLASLTSMNIAEICGLRWKRLNLSAEAIIMDAELLPPFTAAVREQYYKGEYGSEKAKARRRNVPLPPWLVTALVELKKRDRWVGPEDPVFAGVTGKPVCENAIVQRHLKPAGEKLNMPWLSWHDLRRTFATLADAAKISIGERKELMGHARAEQTLAYTHTPSEQARGALDSLADRLVKAAYLDTPKEQKVIPIKKASGQ
jgi:integrase